MKEKEEKLLVPSNSEVIKNRDFGRIKGHLTRHQRVAFASFVKNAYLQMLENDNHEQRYFEVPLSQFREEIGIKYRNIFQDGDEFETEEYSLENQLKQLMTKTLEWRYKDSNNKTMRVRHSVMLSDFEILRDEQLVKYSLGNFLQDKVVCYGNAYISEMPILASFKSGYSVALHEQLEQRKSFNKWKVSVKEFRDLMSILKDEYKAIYDLKRRVINTAIKEIEKNTEYFNLKYKSIKSGRSITHFEFTWGIEKKEKEHKNQSNFANIDEQIEGLKNKIFKIKNLHCKLSDITTSEEHSDYIATVLTSDGTQKADIRLKNDIQESIDMLKEFIV